MPDSERWVVILAGGIGSRFWPASTPVRPKQLLPLAGPRPLIVEAVERALMLAPVERLGLLAGASLSKSLAGALPDLPPEAFWIEPRARGTAPVLTWAAWRIARENPDAVLISLHSDHAIQPASAFTDLLRRASAVAAEEAVLLTLAIRPDRPETGYGYIRTGGLLKEDTATDSSGAAQDQLPRRVAAFVEKPGPETAQRYVEEGYLWNSGIFVWRAGVFLDEIRKWAPEIGTLLPLLDEGSVDEFFERCPSISVDEAVLERSDRVGTMEADFEWDDVGTWEALGRTRTPDDQGNVSLGRSVIVNGTGNIVYSEDDGAVVLFGVDDLITVRVEGVTFVTHRARAHELKELLDQLPSDLRNPGS